MSQTLYDFSALLLNGDLQKFDAYRGKILLIVNTASQCGFTPQYTGLEELYRTYQEKGLIVLGFPCNQFGGQEPGSAAEIKAFCTDSFQVSFPLFDKIDVNGPKRHPLYVALAGPASPVPGNIKWNFNKFLVGRDGKILSRFDSSAAPDSPAVVQAIEAALAAKP